MNHNAAQCWSHYEYYDDEDMPIALAAVNLVDGMIPNSMPN